MSILNVMIKDLELIKQQNFTKIDSLAQLRHSLIRFKESYPGLEKGQEKRLNDCIGGLNRMEKNGSVSKQEADALIDYVDGLVALASNLRKDLGGEK